MMSAKILKVISNCLFLVLILVLIISIYSFVSLNVLNKKYVNFFSYTFFQVGSNSMAPTITTNDILIVKLTKDIKKDDIVTFFSDDVVVTHRVIDINNDSYMTKGDANNTVDRPLNKDMIIGKVSKVIVNGGTWFKVITTPKIIVLICVTLFLFSLAFSYKSKKTLSKNDDFGIYYSGIELKKDGSNDR